VEVPDRNDQNKNPECHPPDGIFFTHMDRTFTCARFEPLTPDQADLLTGILTELGFDGFEENGSAMSAWIDSSHFDEPTFKNKISSTGISYSLSAMKEENWNAAWESSFEPVVIPGKVAVRADFHEPVPDVMHEIVITPKMSFGTGHHATTWLMMDEMMTLDFSRRTVFDFGTGTGILAILAEKLGAERVEAVDNDPWCMVNAEESIQRNGCARIELSMADSLPPGRTYDIILANINKSVLLGNTESLVRALGPGGVLLLSGLLQSDRVDMEAAFRSFLGEPIAFREKNNWILLAFKAEAGARS
jgi:ribosomal protein L11 methyltransferase